MLLDYPTDVRTQKADTADLLRMDDDGWRPEAAWRPAGPLASVGGAGWGVPSGTIPGEREPGPQIRSGAPTTSTQILSDWPMSAATIADRQREGGGGPSQRRRASAAVWRRRWQALRGLLMPAPLSRRRRHSQLPVVEDQARDAP